MAIADASRRTYQAMIIQHLRLLALDLEAQRRFYSERLGFAVVDRSAHALTLQTGASHLTFVSVEQVGAAHGPYHFAFNIAFDQVDAAKTWLDQRVPLLADRGGRSDFRNEPFASHAIYFKDAEGNIGEFIGRQRQPFSDGVGFDAATGVRGISEIGVAVPSVPVAHEAYTAQLGPSRYGVNADGVFGAVGDDDGMLIVVRDGRLWFPDTGIPAQPLWFEADLKTDRGLWRLSGPEGRVAPIAASTPGRATPR